uniref:Putative glucose inhibited division protein B n=1 Tax=Paulinella chromatophora TaxID=39717 RepID=B1X3W6_PAUCH|nr:putative glucose inhibited division protein B [Paulinella chromatophora]ACB42635.1 putative glucose inhibited division protein B [Paulinella chromatophora]
MSSTDSFLQANSHFWKSLGWEPVANQIDQLKLLQILLSEWNHRVNLTRLVEGEDFWITQVFDSLWPLQRLLNNPRPIRCIDVGTGCGFPGLALAIALPEASLTLVDSVGRKIEAVKAIVESLGLSDRISFRIERIERTGQDLNCRNQFDMAIARAVGTPTVVAEYLLPLLAESGEALLYRGRWIDNDTVALKSPLNLLGGRILRLDRCNLLDGRGIRHVIVLKRINSCPIISPRMVGIPTTEPLC